MWGRPASCWSAGSSTSGRLGGTGSWRTQTPPSAVNRQACQAKHKHERINYRGLIRIASEQEGNDELEIYAALKKKMSSNKSLLMRSVSMLKDF